MPFPRLTWAGLLVATLGWGLLLIYPLIASFADSTVRDPARFILIFGENAVVTGLAIALLGAMERVMDLLARQAATVHPAKNIAAATRSAPQFAQQQPAPQHFQAQQFVAQQIAAAQQLANGSFQTSPQKPQFSSAAMTAARQTPEIVTRGALAGRDYVLFRDGSVVVETLLGPRRFLSLSEAQEFIGAN
jgi:predicted component of type VI protein secretion system